MILFPAIDIQDGRVVRLVQGRMEEATVFNENPAAQAMTWQEAGFGWVHVVDLDGAVVGAPKNAGAVMSILDATSCSVQLGGGVRSMNRIAFWIDAGVTRLVLGTAAVRHPELVKEAAREYPERIAVSIDVRDDHVAVEGWVEQTTCDAVELAQRFEDAGVAALIVTDIHRDGLSGGPNIELTGKMADAVRLPIIASGGVSSAEQIQAMRAREGRPIAGAIIGRALYDGALAPAEALTAAGEGAEA